MVVATVWRGLPCQMDCQRRMTKPASAAAAPTPWVNELKRSSRVRLRKIDHLQRRDSGRDSDGLREAWACARAMTAMTAGARNTRRRAAGGRTLVGFGRELGAEGSEVGLGGVALAVEAALLGAELEHAGE